MEIIEKAWKVNLELVEEPWYYDSLVYYSNSKGKAKVQALTDLDCASHVNGELIEYLNIPLIRAKEEDWVEYNGVLMKKRKVEREIAEEKRLEELEALIDGDVEYYHIGKRGLYYNQDCCGYTDLRWRAGVYTKEFAVKHAKGCEDIYLTPIDIEKHNKMVEEQIRYLTENLISAPL